MQNRFGLLILDVIPIYMIIALDIVIIICYSMNCPTLICLPIVCYFSREKPLVKSMALGSLLYHICLQDLFLFAFIFRSINPKIQKYLAAIYCYLFYLAFPRDLFIQSTTILPIFLPVRDWQPLSYVGLQDLLFVCRSCLRGVAWFSY